DTCLVPSAGIAELSLRGVDAHDRQGRATLDDELGERTITAADIGPDEAPWRMHPIEENLPRKPAPDAHHLLVGRAVVEPDRFISHRMFSSCTQEPPDEQNTGRLAAAVAR